MKKEILLAFASFSLLASGQQVLIPTDGEMQQKGKYNDVLETVKGQDYPLGCMATAMSIVMNQHQWPAGYFGEQGTGLPQLCYDAAQSISTVYGMSGSSASLSSVASALVDKFGYDASSVTYYYKPSSGLSDAQWKNLIIRNLNDGMVVIYSSGSGNVRHAFVIDGYDAATDKFHVNAGQGSGVAGNEQWTDLFQIKVGNYTYSNTPEMVTGIRTEQEAARSLSPLKVMSSGKQAKGLYLSAGNVEAGVPVQVSVESLQNLSYDGSAFSGWLLPVLVDGNRQLVLPQQPAQVARSFKGSGAFPYRSVLASLTFENVQFDTVEPDWRVALATFDDDSFSQGKLVEAAPGETEVVTSVNVKTNQHYNISFQGQGVQFYTRNFSAGGRYEELPSTLTLTPGSVYKFYVKAGSTASGSGKVVLMANGEYLMEDYFANQGNGTAYRVFYLRPTADTRVEGEYVFDTNLSTQTISLDEAGTLKEYLAEKGVKPYTLNVLTLSGKINAEDIFYIRDNMPFLKVLDMSLAQIVAYGYHPDNVLPEMAFYKEIYNSQSYSLALEEVRLPETCTTLGSNAFMYCSNLKRVYLPKSVTSFMYNVFFSCRALEEVHVYNPVPVFINWCVFKNVNNATLYVPKGSADVYMTPNSIPGTLYASNEWYNKFQGKCVEEDTPQQADVEIMMQSTNFVTTSQLGKISWNKGGADLPLAAAFNMAGMENNWKLRLLLSYATKQGSKVETREQYYAGTTTDNKNYSFSVPKADLEALAAAGAENVKLKVEVYADLSSDFVQQKPGYYMPFLYDGMEVTVTGDCGDILTTLNIQHKTGLTPADVSITLDNARLTRLWVVGSSAKVTLKGDNVLLADYASTRDAAQINNGLSLSFDGTGSLTLGEDGGTHLIGTLPYCTGTMVVHHGVTLKNLPQINFDNIQLVYARSFARAADGSGSGWETMTLPFDVHSVQKSDGTPLTWAKPGKSGNFWLREFDAAEGTFTSRDIQKIQGGKAYIISMPSSGSQMLSGSTLYFYGPTLNAASKLKAAVPSGTESSTGLVMHPNLYAEELPLSYYRLNRAGDTFTQVTDLSESDPLKQFEAYFVAYDGYMSRIKAFTVGGKEIEGSVTGVEQVVNDNFTITPEAGALRVVSRESSLLRVATLGGLQKTYSLTPGEHRLTMPRGVYVVNGKKYYVR